MRTKLPAPLLMITALLGTAVAAEEGTSTPWFTTSEVADGVWRIDDHGNDNMYLVAGTSRAMLIDTGLGVGDVMKIVRTLTALPVVVVNTHGHPDHAGGNYQVAQVHAHPADFEMIVSFNRKEHRAGTRANALKEGTIGTDQLYPEPDGEPMADLVPVEAGQVFDLGGRTLEVLPVPGHTQGGICLLDKKHRLLFTGDNNNTVQWQFLDTSTPLAAYVETLEAQAARRDFDTLLPGHGPALDKAFIDEQIACARSILEGRCKDEPYPTFAGEKRLCRCGRAAIAFGADKLP